jgi:hypothetical protein
VSAVRHVPSPKRASTGSLARTRAVCYCVPHPLRWLADSPCELVDGIQRIYHGGWVVDGIQVHKVVTVSRSKSGNVWIYNTVCTGYTWSPLTLSTTLYALATLGAHSPSLPHCLHWLHLVSPLTLSRIWLKSSLCATPVVGGSFPRSTLAALAVACITPE